MSRTDYYGNDLKVGDLVIWAPYRFLSVGKMCAFTEYYIKVNQYYRYTGGWKMHDKPFVIRTTLVYKINELPPLPPIK